MSVTIFDKEDYEKKLSELLGMELDQTWSNQLVKGRCLINDILVSYSISSDDSEAIYLITSSRRNRSLEDMIFVVSFSERRLTVIVPPRPMIGYLSLSKDETVMTWPVFEGTTFRLFYRGSWLMSSRNSIIINDARLFDETFEDLFLELLPGSIDESFDKNKSYVISMTNIKNAHGASKNRLIILEESVKVSEGFMVTLKDVEDKDHSLGTVSRTRAGFCLDLSAKYKRMNETFYGIKVSPGVNRLYYSIIWTILSRKDSLFSQDFPRLRIEYNSIKDHIDSLVKGITSLCLTKNKRSKDAVGYLGQFANNMAESIGLLKGASAIHVVRDTLHDTKYAESITNSYETARSIVDKKIH